MHITERKVLAMRLIPYGVDVPCVLGGHDALTFLREDTFCIIVCYPHVI